MPRTDLPRQSTLVAVVGFAIAFGSANFSGAQAQVGLERQFDRLDTNGSGVLEPLELEKVPGFLKQQLDEAGVSLDQPMSRDEFADLWRAIEERRRNRENNSRQGDGRSGPDGTRGDDPQRADERPGDGRSPDDGGERRGRRRGGPGSGGPGGPSSGGPTSYGAANDVQAGGDGRGSNTDTGATRPAGKSAAGMPATPPSGGSTKIKTASTSRMLPDEWKPCDKNGDGQVALHECERAKWTEFRRLDRNGDGFLTTSELQPRMGVQSITVVPSSAADGSSKPVGVASGSDTTTDGADVDVPAAVAPQTANLPSQTDNAVPVVKPEAGPDATEREATGFFDRLDRNKNGTVDPDEWVISKRLKPRFESSGASLSAPMSREEFVKIYRQTKS